MRIAQPARLRIATSAGRPRIGRGDKLSVLHYHQALAGLRTSPSSGSAQSHWCPLLGPDERFLPRLWCGESKLQYDDALEQDAFITHGGQDATAPTNRAWWLIHPAGRA